MAQLAQMNVTMNAMQGQLKTYHWIQQTKQVPGGSITVGAEGEIILIGVKHAQPRKRATRKRPTTTID